MPMRRLFVTPTCEKIKSGHGEKGGRVFFPSSLASPLCPRRPQKNNEGENNVTPRFTYGQIQERRHSRHSIAQSARARKPFQPGIDYSRSAGIYDLCKSARCISTSWNASGPNSSSVSGKGNSRSENAKRWRPSNRSSVNNMSRKSLKPCRNAVVQGCADHPPGISTQGRVIEPTMVFWRNPVGKRAA